MGQIPLSYFATKQQATILSEFNALLLAPMTGHPWSDIGAFVDKHLSSESDAIMTEAKCMIVTYILMLVGSWQFRYTERL